MSSNVPSNARPEIGIRLFGLSQREAAGYLIGAVMLAVLLTAAGAFDSDELDLGHRFGLWLIVSILGVAQTLALDGLIAPRLPIAPWGRALAGALTIAGVVLLMAGELHALKFTPLLPYPPDPFFEFVLFLAPPIGAIAAIVVTARVIAPEGLTPRRLPLAAPAEIPRVGFQSVIAGYLPPPSVLADWPSEPVLRVRADDHYLEIFTARGRRFLRGRMKDALRILANAEGVQPHRSWWVAHAEIAGLQRQGRDYVLTTRDGGEIPVARSRLEEIRRRVGA